MPDQPISVDALAVELHVDRDELLEYIRGLKYDTGAVERDGLTPTQAAKIRARYLTIGGIGRMLAPPTDTGSRPTAAATPHTDPAPVPPVAPPAAPKPPPVAPPPLPVVKRLPPPSPVERSGRNTSTGANPGGGETTRKVRVFALAKELNVESKLLLDYCKELGFGYRNQLDGMLPEQAEALRERVKKGPKPGGTRGPGAPAAPGAPPKIATLPPIAKPLPKPVTTGSAPTELPAVPVPERAPLLNSGAPIKLTPDQVARLREAANRGERFASDQLADSAPQGAPEAPDVAALRVPQGELAEKREPAGSIAPMNTPGGTSADTIANRTPVRQTPVPVSGDGARATQQDPVPTTLHRPTVPLATAPARPERPDGSGVRERVPELPPEPGMPALFHTEVRLQFPFPVALPYYRVAIDTDRRAQTESLINAVQALLKYLTFLGLSDLFQCLAQKTGGALTVNGPLLFLQKEVPVTLGQWRVALRETCRRLKAEPAATLVVPELADACAEGTAFDRLLGDIIAQRNDWAHDEHMLTLTADEADDLFRYIHPRLLRAFWHVRFLSEYVLGFARSLVRATATSSAILRFHSCVGHQIAGQEETFPASLPVKPDVPFVVAPDHTRLLYLWPFLGVQVAATVGRPTLYTFIKVTDRGACLSHVRLAALDARRETLTSEFVTPRPADFVWLLDRVRDQYRPHVLPTGGKVGKLGDRLRRRTKESLVDQVLGSYTLTAWIGAGGNGTVYAARGADGQPVAVKVLSASDDEEHIARFEQEFRKLKELPHPHVIRVFAYDGVVIDDRLYLWFAMEYASRGTLAERAAGRKPPAGSAAMPWDTPEHRTALVAEFRSIATALAHLHANDLIHRDVKPANVLVAEDGGLRLADFGLIKSLAPSEHTRQVPRSLSGIGLGTPSYMSPEQYRGDHARVNKPSDVYSLCLTLAELATGERPVHDLEVKVGSTLDAVAKVRALPGPLSAFILTGTAAAPHERFPDADAALAAFDQDVAPLTT